jgi:hypothetical protein
MPSQTPWGYVHPEFWSLLWPIVLLLFWIASAILNYSLGYKAGRRDQADDVSEELKRLSAVMAAHRISSPSPWVPSTIAPFQKHPDWPVGVYSRKG